VTARILACVLAVALAIGGCLPRHSPIAVDGPPPEWLARDRQGRYYVLQDGHWIRCYNIYAFLGCDDGVEPNLPYRGLAPCP
jgi:hypothetical protein